MMDFVEYAWQERAEEERDQVKQQLATSQSESRNTLERAQLSHNSVVQGLQQQLHDALEGRTAAEGRQTCNFGL